MKFDIARQPLVPAFLTLLAFAVAFACTIGPVPEVSGAVGPAIAANGHPAVGGPANAGLALTMPDRWPALLQAARPGWSKAIAALLLLFTGLTAGRLAVRYNLYAVATCLGIPLFGLFVCGIGSGTDYLSGLCTVALLALSVKHFARAFCNGYAFDALFRASFYLGLTLLSDPATLPLLLLLPLAVILFRRTLREAVVALAGLVLGPLALCYVNWGMGGDFAAPLASVVQTFLSGEPLGLFAALPLPQLVLLGGILLLDLAAVFCLLTDMYAVGTKARFILLFNIGTLAAACGLLCGPAAIPTSVALAAFPSALLQPFLFVRMNRALSATIYPLLLAAAAAGLFLQ
ncbi:hypothetical protein [Alistipes sp.]|uniref:hypothetical protein n=1 Tax=Alistipes sp. TaxID=1872444 RepID=UPI003AF18279